MKLSKEEKINNELQRLLIMKKFENENRDKIVAGIDEAGRGPLAGPVVAGCVVIDLNYDYLYLNDSKKMTENRRNLLYNLILETCLAYGIGIVDNNKIDEINILEATHLAMKEAYENCSKLLKSKYDKNIDLLLVDALKIKNIDLSQIPIIHGDAISLSIAAASVLAKVTRDKIMVEYRDKYPNYNFMKHKGYGTKEHIESIKKYGPCEIHRKTFIKNFV